MRKFISSFLILSFCLIASNVQAQSLIPPLQLSEGVTLKFSGYSWNLFTKEEDKPGKSTWNRMRLRMNLNTNTPFSAYAEVDIVKFLNDMEQLEDSGFLRQLYISYSLTKDWQLRAGRLFTDPSLSPGPFEQQLVRNSLAAGPFVNPPTQYALQLRGNLGYGYSMVTSVSVDTSEAFAREPNWDKPAFSGQLKKVFGKTGLSSAVMTQLSDEFQRYGFESKYQFNEKLNFRGGVIMASNQSDRDHLGGYLLAGYKALDWLELHSQVDYRHLDTFGKKKEATDTVWTNGIRVWTKKDQMAVTLDYETALDGTRDNQLLVRFQVRF